MTERTNFWVGIALAGISAVEGGIIAESSLDSEPVKQPVLQESQFNVFGSDGAENFFKSAFALDSAVVIVWATKKIVDLATDFDHK